jgi:hypothetical protein
MLPLQPGAVYAESGDERRSALNINVFRDKTTYAPGAYLLVPDDVLEHPGRHRADRNPLPHAGVVSLRDGDVFPVGKKYWLPRVGYNVEHLHDNPRLARIYAGVHGDQGAFHVRDGELIWIDSGLINRSILIQAHDQISTPQAAEQDFVPTANMGMSVLAVNGIRSVFQAPAEISGLHDVTGRS